MILEIKRLQDPREILAWRTEVIKEVFDREPSLELLLANHRYIHQHLADDTLYFLKVELDTSAAGCGAICFSSELPSPDNPLGFCAFLMNIYIREQFRSNGLASLLISHLLNEARGRGAGKIYLESTPEAADIYSHLGFDPLKNYFIYPQK